MKLVFGGLQYKLPGSGFIADNGGNPAFGGNNWPLRGGKATTWEGGVRGPAFVTGPVLPRERSVNRELIHVSDWFPTLARLGGANISGMTLDGFDMWNTLR